MPTISFTSVTTNAIWTAPFATRSVTCRCVGGGASGYRDCDGDDEGGGGGGGGYAEQTRNVSQGTQLFVTVGAGGGSPGCQSGNNGGTSQVVGGPIGVRATGGTTGTDDAGGGGGGFGSIGDIVRSGGSGSDDDSGQDGGGAGNRNGNSGSCGNARGGRGTNTSGNQASCPGGRSGANFGAGGAGNDGGSAGSGARGMCSITWDYEVPRIDSFQISPNPQNSSTGVPSYSTTISWVTSFANSVTLTSSAGETWTSSPVNITNLPQSNANGTSPSSRSYTLTASNDGGSVVSQTQTARARNDNTPSNSWATSFINLEPSTQVTISLGNLAGVDMPTTISTSGSGNFVGSGGSFSGTRNFSDGETIQLRSTTLPFNTDVSGISPGSTFGKTNTKTIVVQTPSGSFNVTFVTRAPRIREDFDYTNNLNKYPYEDIDVISNNPVEYLTSSQIPIDDIEINQEIKANYPDVQISINGGNWQNVREI